MYALCRHGKCIVPQKKQQCVTHHSLYRINNERESQEDRQYKPQQHHSNQRLDWMNDFPLCHIWSLGRYKDIKIGQKTNTRLGSARPAFYFSVKCSWEWFSCWWTFQWRSSQFSAALPTTTNPSLSFLALASTQGQLKLGPGGRQGGQKDEQELVSGWLCQGMVEGRRGRWRRRWEGTLEARGEAGFTSNPPETLCDSGLRKWARGWRDGEGEAKYECREGFWSVKQL